MIAARSVVFAAVSPLVGAVASVALILTLDLPDPIAVHWGLTGADGFGGVGDLIAPVVIFVPIVTAVMVAFLVFSTHNARSPLFGRFIVGATVTIGLGISFSSAAIALAQVGVDDAASVSAGTSLGYVGVAFAAAGVLGVAAGLLTPRTTVSVTPASDAPALPLGATERATWSRSVVPSMAAVGVLSIAMATVAATIVIAGAPIAVLLVVFVVMALVLSMLLWRVTVDSRGVTVRSAFGLPRVHIAAGDVVEARAIEVDPVRQFGGWGIRYGALGWGVVVRGGPAIEVTREGKMPFIVTVADAATGAALLTALAQRERA